jgi:hypothetical protein
MAAVDATLFSASIAIIFTSVYLLKFIRIENFLSKLCSCFPTWFGNSKADLQHLDEVAIASPHEPSAPPTYTSSWWTGERHFQLERRAIFSKVRKLPR